MDETEKPSRGEANGEPRGSVTKRLNKEAAEAGYGEPLNEDLPPNTRRYTPSVVKKSHETCKKRVKIYQQRKRRYANQTIKAKDKLVKVKKELSEREAFLEAVSNAPTPAQVRKALLSYMNEKDLHPIAELIDLATSPRASRAEKIKLWTTIAEFTTPKLKSVDVSGTVSGEVIVNVQDYTKISQASLDPVSAAKRVADAEIVDAEDAENDEYSEFISEEDKIDGSD